MLESHIACFYAKTSHFSSVRSKRAILSEIPLSILEIDKNSKQIMNQHRLQVIKKHTLLSVVIIPTQNTMCK